MRKGSDIHSIYKFIIFSQPSLVLSGPHPQVVGEVVQSEGLDHGACEELPGSPASPGVPLSQADTDALPGTEGLQAGVLVAGVPGVGLGGGGVAGVTLRHVSPRNVEPLRVPSSHPGPPQTRLYRNIWLESLNCATDFE